MATASRLLNGLRLDFGTQDNLFFFDNVIGVMDTGTDTLTITGTVLHATAGTDAFSGQVFQLDAEIHFTTDITESILTAMNQQSPSTIFDRLNGNTTFLTLSEQSDAGDGGGFAPDFNGPLDWVDYMGFHIDTEHRDSGILEGWGWLTPDDETIARVPADDWLFTMTPVPEPTTIALMLMGLGGLGARASKRGKSNA